ncbi:MAG: ADP-ribosylglycohydrolase family protein [Blastocatellia bacterium]|nr:ADP-ribosylglycohydrolase family protein [Blastocatellia bacterium]
MKERFQGCLLGVALGDALGAPVKGQSSKEIKALANLPAPGAAGRETESGPWKFAAGDDTDDANLMALTLESICTQRSINPSDMVRRLRGWYGTHPKNLTPLTAHVVARLAEGERWEEASEGASLDVAFEPPDAGHFARTIPVALYHARRPEKLVADTITVARLTHWDDRCTHGAVALNYLISRFTQNDAKAFDSLTTFLSDKNVQVRETVKAAPGLAADKLDASGTALGTLAVALWAAQQAPSFKEGLLSVLALGGATDINGAVAGGVLGARFGRQAIPYEWQIALQEKVRVEVLSNRLFEHA